MKPEKMDFRGKLLAPCANRKYGDKFEIEFLAEEFLERLMLFDKFILDSIRLQEIPHLIKVFGYTPVLELLKSGILLIHSETFGTFGSTGQSSKVSAYRAKKGDLPLCSYCIDPFSIYPYDSTREHENDYKKDQKQFTHQNLQLINQIDSISSKQAKKLREAVARRVIHFSSDSVIKEISDQNYTDFRGHDPTIKVAIASRIKALHNQEVNPDAIELKIEFIDERDFRVESNIESKLSLNKETTHKVIERALLGITGRNHNIARMREFNCLVGYRENEVPIFSSKLDFLVERIATDRKLIPNFHRVLSAKGLPNFSEAVGEGRIDLLKVLEIRESRECVDFRTWLWSQDNIDETELKERLNSFSQRWKDFFKTVGGKTISWLASTSLSAIPIAGNIIGAGMSFYDKFLAREVLPHEGAITFINNKLPSIYQKPKDRDFFKPKSQ
ncbi:MAG: hypothetical protein ACREOW_07790 [Thermodesulfobacteriota bacterium]